MRTLDHIAITAIIDCMSQMTIRGLDPAIKQRLRLAAAANGRSMEAEAREILRIALDEAPGAARPTTAEELRQRLRGVRGLWKDRGTSDELMKLTRGED
jgi:antitoxin FitA